MFSGIDQASILLLKKIRTTVSVIVYWIC
ncbi:hypothetical protein DESC_730125 [Desulfosarcina cetonica]|nr:hypothetical protein DESC_730125 [Desulfosarcina cetonica]